MTKESKKFHYMDTHIGKVIPFSVDPAPLPTH